MFGGFNGGQQNNNGTPSINTKVRTMYGEIACLQLAYWNENLSIKINPSLGLNEQGIRQYDFNRRGSTALTPDKSIALAEKMKELILPEIEKVKVNKTLEKPISTGLTVGNKGSFLAVEYKDSNGVPSLFLTLYTNIGQDNKAPQDGVYSYKFTKTTTVDNYDPESGTGTESILEAEFLYFYEKVKTIADIHATAAHSIAVNNAFKPRNNGNGYQNQGNFSAPQPNNGGGMSQPPFSQPSQNNYTAPMSTFSSEDLPF